MTREDYAQPRTRDHLANSGGHVTRDESFAMDEDEEDDDDEEEEEEEGPYVCRGNLSRRVGSAGGSLAWTGGRAR